MISFLQDPEKMAEAESIATGILGFTGIGGLIQLLKLVIISVWCLAESLCDVKTLLKGGRISVIKESYHWSVSSFGLRNFSKSVLPAVTDSKGLSYTDHLRLLLLEENTQTLAFRMMDLIQWNMQENYQPEFLIRDCICKAEMETEYHANQLFSAFPFVNTIVSNGKAGYSFRFSQKYDY